MSSFYLSWIVFFSREFSEVKRKSISLETSGASQVFGCMVYASRITLGHHRFLDAWCMPLRFSLGHQFASTFETFEFSILLPRMTSQQVER